MAHPFGTQPDPRKGNSRDLFAWQPIASAPKNGDMVLIARIPDDIDDDYPAEAGVVAHWAHFAEGWGWFAQGLGFVTDTGLYVPGNGKVSDNGWTELQPTHWLALPHLGASR